MRSYILQLEYRDSGTKQERLSRAADIIRSLESPDIILLPELWATGFFSYGDYEKNSEAADGETFALLSKLAREKDTYIFTGSFTEKSGGRLYNTALLLDRSGEIAAAYRKIHLFGDEKKLVSPGTDIVTAETELGVIGMSICYDLRFPELYRRLSEKGAELFLSCYALPAERLEHWRILTPARALENQAFFLSCGCSGKNNGVLFSGHSMIVTPRGEILREGGIHEKIICADIDPEAARRYRESFPALKDRVLF